MKNKNTMKKIYLLSVLLLCATIFKGQTLTTNNWRISVSEGAGYLIDNRLKWGVQVNPDIHYFIHPNWGVGVKYSFFTAANSWDWQGTLETPPLPSLSSWILPYHVPLITVNTEQTSSIHYVGTSLLARFRIGDSRWTISPVLSGGSVFNKITEKTVITDIGNKVSSRSPSSFLGDGGDVRFRDLSDTDSSSDYFIPIPENQPVIRNGFGISTGIGIEYSFNKHISLGTDCGYFHSFLKKDRISRLDFSLGIKIYL